MPIESRETHDGPQISHDSLCVGDYGGSGSHGLGNINWLEEHHGNDVTIEHGAYYSRQAWLPDTEEYRELLAALDDYPVFDDESVSEVETEWELEAWESYVRYDLLRTLPDDTEDMAELLDDAALFQAYRAAMDACNEYPIAEYSGVCIRIDRIKDAFREQIELALINHDRAEDGLPAIQ